jgi:CRP-like cAMP-binding protein
MSLSQEDRDSIKEVLKKLDWYAHLQESELNSLLAGFEKATMVRDEHLITEGKTGEIFYIIATGSVGVFLKRKLVDKQVATLLAGEFFGEMSLISDEPRSASVVCLEDGLVYTLLRSTFRKIIMANPYIGDRMRKAAAERRSEDRAIEFGEWMGKGLK